MRLAAARTSDSNPCLMAGRPSGLPSFAKASDGKLHIYVGCSSQNFFRNFVNRCRSMAWVYETVTA